MWNLLPSQDIPPSRRYRYCCVELKECHGVDRVTVTGVRWEESARRKASHNLIDFCRKPLRTRKVAEHFGLLFDYNEKIKSVTISTENIVLNDDNEIARRMVELCYRTNKTLVNPIVDWTTEDVWAFLNDNNIPHCCLYDEGYKRLGCIGCPMANSATRNRDFERYPKYKTLYLHAFEKMLINHPGQIKFFNDLPEPPKDVKEAAEILFDHWLNIDYISEEYQKEKQKGDPNAPSNLA